MNNYELLTHLDSHLRGFTRAQKLKRFQIVNRLHSRDALRRNLQSAYPLKATYFEPKYRKKVV